MKPATKIPKRIWFVWLQGLDHAPNLVHRCLQSWTEKNPSWTLTVLDYQNLGVYLDLPAIVDVDRADISIQKIANLIRINLLQKFGGVWVDATCYCCSALDEWLPRYAEAGFFVLQSPRADRILSNWFMVSACPHYLTRQVCQEMNRFWQKHHFSNQNNRFGRLVLALGRRRLKKTWRARFWLSGFAVRVLGVYPYFIFHYQFEQVVRKDATCRAIWEAIPYLDAVPAHRVQSLGLYSPIDERAKACIDTLSSPVQKLSWKTANPGSSIEGTVLEYFYHRYATSGEATSGVVA